MTKGKAFSGKQKKEQLQAKNERKRNKQNSLWDSDFKKNTDESKKDESKDPGALIVPLGTRNRLTTAFARESKEDVEQRKKDAHRPLDMSLRSRPWAVLFENMNEAKIDFPHRPHWDQSTSIDTLKQRELTYFMNYVKQLTEAHPAERLNYFERNLEVWRQLWRVFERSDIILLITDARFPLFHFPPALYDYVTKVMKKPLLLVMNKADIVDKKIVDAWEAYFHEVYPNMKILRFSSFRPIDAQKEEESMEKKRRLQKGRRKYETAGGRAELLAAIQSFNITKNGQVVVIPEVQHSEDDEDEEEDADDSDEEEGEDDPNAEVVDSEPENTRYVGGQPSDQYITIGTVGHPNVGKSSLINGLMRKKVVSTSRTPGHTKHFQTIFLAKNVQLCDCPGLVFPALDRPKPLQILCGVFPIAQIREPFSALRYLAERVPVEKIYGLHFPEDETEWNPYNMCEAFAIKRGYIVSKSGAPDVHRAGREILRDCLDGNIVISWPPPQKDGAAAANTTTNTSSDANESAPTAMDVDDEGEDEEQQADNSDEEEAEANTTTSKSLDKKRKKKAKKSKALKLELKPDPSISGLDMDLDDDAEDGRESQPAKAKKHKNKKASSYADKLAERQTKLK